MVRTQISDDKVKEIMIDGITKGANYVLNKSSFYEHVRTYHKIAKQRSFQLYDKYYLEIQTERNKAKLSNSIESENKRQNKAILTKIERMEIASSIAKGISWKSGLEIITPNANDRLKALDYLSKIEGDYMATKIDHTTNGNEIQSLPVSLNIVTNLSEQKRLKKNK